ncbi:MAG: hypothetical protein BGO12_13485 [Verrucomicrobia bacterium 61-8]|nr:C40 family peptidase [Verrucomicrobiota bacterium]OJV00675.1 MAG: hypothetical protein BGO12_13485 [Verrucomicrobia bacterium 61-8]
MERLTSKRLIPLGFMSLFIFSSAMLVGLLVQPINSGLARLAICAFGLLSTVSATVLFWRHRWFQCVIGCAFIIIAAIALWPSVSPGNLRTRYVAKLRTFEGTPYVWGGEGRLGIDCSGLPRTAWRKTLFDEGLRTMNPSLIRQSFLSWWNDVAARDLPASADYRRLELNGRLSQLPYERLQPGDLAVTSSGVHCLVYLGNGDWIEADPAMGKVIILNKSQPDSWLSARCVIARRADF